jgi:hypothetical protein
VIGLRRGAVTALFVLLARPVTAACVIPDRLFVDLGVWIATESSRVSAPGTARLTGDGSLCTSYTVTGTITVSQDNPAVNFVQTESRYGGELTYTLDAPARQGSCYSGVMEASGWGISSMAHAAGGCWYLPPPPPPPSAEERCEG